MVNLGGVARVDYALMYQANGVGQGVQGGFAPSKKGVFAKDLYLGTCSAKVCTPHKNIKNIKLQVTTKYKNGKSATRTYTVK